MFSVATLRVSKKTGLRIVLGLALSYALGGMTSSAMASAQDGSVAVGVNISPATLDPTTNPSEGIRNVTYANIYEGLTAVDEQGAIHPLLAQAWSISPDGLHYTFFLHPGVHFHDGTPLTCATVKFSLDRARSPESLNPQKLVFENIQDVSCSSDMTVLVTLRTAHASFLSELAWADAVIVAPQSASGNAQHPIGTGPFIFKDWKRAESITLEKNQAYWGTPAKLNAVTFRFYTEPLAAANALLDGQLDAYPSFPAPEMAARFEQNSAFVVKQGLAPFKAMLALNNRRKLFAQPLVRQALMYALDRAGITEAMDIPGALVLGSHMSPENPNYTDLSDVYPYNPGKAKALLKQVGVEPGTRLKLVLPPIGYAHTTGELVAAYLEQIGLNVTIVQLEWPAWLAQVFGHHDFDMTIIAHTEPDDIGIYARKDYYFGYNNSSFQALYAAYEAEQDPVKRHTLSVQMQEKLAHDVPNVFLFFVPRTNIARREVKGLWNRLPLPATPMSNVFWGQ
ncbi:peptide ABC transporter [Acetobacter malorum DSM 14337]|uniref:Peptide ABC transporter n=1 Tax=Acetobacter malorum DSM 14337 TaxID=1307910 RepID=A0ABQ0PSW7_9PROT|nr:ABC transporter substrate-binding protein [Acetobacter malorum]GBQ80202.1 peptide ABC transporter [Acetobacter malorum DSM 14337]